MTAGQARTRCAFGSGPKGTRFNSCRAHSHTGLSNTRLYQAAPCIWSSRPTCMWTMGPFEPRGLRLARQLPDRVSGTYDAWNHYTAVGSSQPEFTPDWRVDEPQRIVAEPR